ncbi:unnamed protein product [Effrenium voratum]|nr:unnamed protein product [Effrenium voratum]
MAVIVCQFRGEGCFITLHFFSAETGVFSEELAKVQVPDQPRQEVVTETVKAAIKGDKVFVVAGTSCWSIRMGASSSRTIQESAPPLPAAAFPYPGMGSRRQAQQRPKVLGLTFGSCGRVFVLTSSSYRAAAKIHMWKPGTAEWKLVESHCKVYRSTTLASCGAYLYVPGGFTAHHDSSDCSRQAEEVVVLRVKRASVHQSSITLRSSPHPSSSVAQRRRVAVSDVFYSQDSVASSFGGATAHAGQPLDSLVADLMRRKILADDPALVLDVIDCGGRLISLTNRRLHCLRTYSERSGKAVNVNVDVWPLREDVILPEGKPITQVFCQKFTTHDCGASVRQRESSLTRATSASSLRFHSAHSRSTSRGPRLPTTYERLQTPRRGRPSGPSKQVASSIAEGR